MSQVYTSFVDFIIPTYQRYDQIKSMLYSLIAQYDSDWSAQVIIDDIENDTIVDIIKNINDKRINYTFTGQRYNDWGHTPREIGKQQSTSQYIIMTGDDNYYAPTLVSKLKAAASVNNNPIVIYWDMIHSHNDYAVLVCTLAISCIDMGAFATRSDIAKVTPLKQTYAADGEFIEHLTSLYAADQFYKIHGVLFVHN
jgi:hypothetical protein